MIARDVRGSWPQAHLSKQRHCRLDLCTHRSASVPVAARYITSYLQRPESESWRLIRAQATALNIHEGVANPELQKP